MTWTAAGGNTIEFTIENSWRRSAYTTGNGRCRNIALPGIPSTSCTGGGGLPGVGDVIEEEQGTGGGTRFNPGDGSGLIGSPIGGLLYKVTAIDPTNDLLVGLALDPDSLPSADTTIGHTYATTGNFTAFIATCCRVSASGGHINNADGDYRLETRVNVGTGNRSPVSSMPAIVQCPINGVCAFQIPGSDPDGDPLRFRFSTASEAGSGFTQPGPPDAPNASSINADTGAFTWNTTGADLDSPTTLYSAQVMVEDLTGIGGSVKSRVPVDFFIQLVSQVGTAPVFDQPPTPTCGSTINATPFNLVSFAVQASDADALQQVTLNASGLPGGASMTPGLPAVADPVSSTFNWTPTTGDAGAHVVTFTATDDALLQTLCSITIQVASCQSNGDCDDGEVCTVDTCAPGSPGADSGGCLNTPLSCDDSDVCTDDTCVLGQGCVNVDNTAPCSDGNFCTVNDQCGGGSCGGAPRDCSGENDQCNVGVCNETADECQPQPSNEGGSCEDGLFCTVNDVCGGGICDGVARDCSGAGGGCTQGACNESTDLCDGVPINEGGSCDDGLFCTENETCAAGVCGGGSARDCSDVQACTSDVCDENGNICSHAVVGNCCGNGVLEGAEECDDANGFGGDGCENDCTFTPADGCNVVHPGTPSERFVGGCDSPSFGTIQAAIAASQDGDTVSVCPGTYTDPVTIDKEITLRSTGGAAVTTLQTSGVALMIARSAVTIDGLTIESDTTAVSADSICPVGQATCGSPGERGSNLTIVNNVIRSSTTGLTWSGKVDCVVIADNTFDANDRHIELVQTGILSPALLVNITDNDITNGGSSGSAVSLSGMIITFAANKVEGSAATGVRVDMAPAGMQLLENDIDSNAGDGITVGASGVAVRIRDNNITGNGVGLGNDATSGEVDATVNWWRSQSGPSGVFTGAGDSIVNRSGATTAFIEFLCRPFPQGFPSVLGVCGVETAELRMLYEGSNPDVDPVGGFITFESHADLNVDPRTSANNSDQSQEVFLLSRTTKRSLGGICLGGTTSGATCRINLDCPGDVNADPLVLNGDCVLLTQVTDAPLAADMVRLPRVTTRGKSVTINTDVDLTGTNGDQSAEVLVWDRRKFAKSLPPFLMPITQEGVDSQQAAPGLTGRRVVVESEANFTGENGDGNREIFVRDLKRNQWTQLTQTTGSIDNRRPSASGSGKQIVFDSTADLDNDLNTTATNPDGNYEVFLARRTAAGYIFTQITDTQLSATLEPVENRVGSIGKLGKQVAFSSNADLVGQNPDGNREVFVWVRGQITQITHSTPGTCSATCAPQPECRIECGNVNPRGDRFGRFIAFESTEDLDNDGATNRRVFLHNVTAGQLLRLSRSRFGENRAPRISNGRFVVWESTADLTGGNPQGDRVIYLFDRRKDD